MPSPFPGMDPYFEDPALWPDVHHELISVAREMLLASLRPKYFVQIDERLYLSDDYDDARALLIPAISVKASTPELAATHVTGTAMSIEPGIEIESAFQTEIHESWLKIIDRQNHHVVTVIEILSPANKEQGSAGQRSYIEKKNGVLASDSNLVEIDLLRAGTPLVPNPRFAGFDYFGQVWRWTGKRHRQWVWPMRLTEKLKPIPVPVRIGDPDAVLDLQAVLNTAYDRAGYELRVNYTNAPMPPLSSEAAEWSRRVILPAGTPAMPLE